MLSQDSARLLVEQDKQKQEVSTQSAQLGSEAVPKTSEDAPAATIAVPLKPKAQPKTFQDVFWAEAPINYHENYLAFWVREIEPV
ncbi:hypothetical protein [Legionella tunisiensis]|uniref:hypothetical protein n=1 Tax=Legionella tunisiensis TaxID=1034944 RepID=UPI0002EDFFCE|nr:hypothetical protein [Legionella tunisiensis]